MHQHITDHLHPLVSVIVPIHNTEMYLHRCIQSILNQTYQNIQLVLIDDCSEDGSYTVCKQYVMKDSRVKLLKQPSRGGVSKARNCGLINAEGNLACFIDADDFINNDYIEILVEAITKKQTSVVFCRYKYYFNGKYIKRPIRIEEGLYAVSETSQILIDDGTLTGILFGSVCGAIYDMEYIRNQNIVFDESLVRNEDGVFNLALLSKIENFYVMNYDGYSYRQWKMRKKFPLFEPDEGFRDATEVIIKKFKNFNDFELQLRRRALSTVFWNAIRIGQCEGSFIENHRRLKQYIIHSSIKNDYNSLKFAEIGKYKYFLINLLYKNHIVLFHFLMKYIYPIIQRYR